MQRRFPRLPEGSMTDYARARFNMVEGQVKPNRVTDPMLLQAMLEVPRELFVPKAARGIACVDEDIPIGRGRHLVEPMVFGRLVDAAAPLPGDMVLVVGAGTGYSAAVLARLANTVVALEGDPTLAREATDLLARLGADNAVVVEGPLTEGYPRQAPYDVIIVEGAVAAVPEAILGQLADGGRLATVVSADGRMGRAVLFQRFGVTTARRVLFDAATPFLPGFAPRPVFEF
jgi:protein-L-isoaspartate(D-aspartate) O-methyltransferase